MFVRSTITLLALATPLLAQGDTDATKAQTVGANAFYKAYFLDKNDPKNKAATAKAIELYTAFVASNPNHEHASRAAANCAVLLYASGDVKKAEAFVGKYGKVMAAAEAKDAEAGGRMGMFRGFGRGRGGGRGGERPVNPNQATIDKLLAMHEKSDETGKARLGAAITRLGGVRDLMMARFGGGRGGFGGRGGRGGFGGGRGGRGRGLTKPKITEMSNADAKRAVEQMVTAAERYVDSMAARGQADQADALEAKLDKIQDLVDDGKLAEAQKLIDGIDVGGNRGRRGAGGERRRRGGEAGGDAGGRRRGGADTGEGGERRRRR